MEAGAPSQEQVASRQRARNEVFFREVNERIKDVSTRSGGDDLIVLCECGRPECLEQLEITLAEYERVRAHDTWFIVARGHVIPEDEQPLKADGDHVVVEKVGQAAEIAEHEQPSV